MSIATIIEELRDLYANGPKTQDNNGREGGICGEIYRRLESDYLEYCQLAEQAYFEWPKFSGRTSYPVPHPNFVGVRGHWGGSEKERDAFVAAEGIWSRQYDNRGLWADTAYGDLRRELVAFLIDWFEERQRKAD